MGAKERIKLGFISSAPAGKPVIEIAAWGKAQGLEFLELGPKREQVARLTYRRLAVPKGLPVVDEASAKRVVQAYLQCWAVAETFAWTKPSPSGRMRC